MRRVSVQVIQDPDAHADIERRHRNIQLPRPPRLSSSLSLSLFLVSCFLLCHLLLSPCHTAGHSPSLLSGFVPSIPPFDHSSQLANSLHTSQGRPSQTQDPPQVCIFPCCQSSRQRIRSSQIHLMESQTIRENYPTKNGRYELVRPNPLRLVSQRI